MAQYKTFRFNEGVNVVDGMIDCQSNYSFGNQIYGDFIDRQNKIKEVLGLEDNVSLYVEGVIKEEGNKQYDIETVIKSESPVFNQLFLATNFLDDITNNPIKIVKDLNYQEKFIESVGLLKKEGIKLENVFNLLSDFQRSYTFSEYITFDPEEKSVTYHLWSIKAGDAISHELKTDLNLGIKNVISKLHEDGLINIDYNKVAEIKEKYRASFFKDKSATVKKDIAYFREMVKQGKKADNPLLSISESSSFEEVIDKINQKDIITYFPFSSKISDEFLLETLKKEFK
jgi:hypothetical protein